MLSTPKKCPRRPLFEGARSFLEDFRMQRSQYSMQELYPPNIEDYPHAQDPGSMHSDNHSRKLRPSRWFYCREEPFTVHKSVSEASMYRANSRFSLKSDNKTLDYLMRCFWVCSTGCHQTT